MWLKSESPNLSRKTRVMLKHRVSSTSFLTRQVSAHPKSQAIFDPQDNTMVTRYGAGQRHRLTGHHHQVLWLLRKHGLHPFKTGKGEKALVWDIRKRFWCKEGTKACIYQHALLQEWGAFLHCHKCSSNLASKSAIKENSSTILEIRGASTALLKCTLGDSHQVPVWFIYEGSSPCRWFSAHRSHVLVCQHCLRVIH